MKKKSKYISLLSALSIMVVAFSISNFTNIFRQNNNTDANLTNITLSKDNVPTIDGEGNGTLKYGYACFSYTQASLFDNYHVKISSGGTLTKDSCYGINKFTAVFSNNSNSLSIMTAYEQDTLSSGRYDHIYSFKTGEIIEDMMGDYFLISFSEDTLIEILTIYYKCFSKTATSPLALEGKHSTVMTDPNKWYMYEENEGKFYRTPIINDKGTIIADVSCVTGTKTSNYTYLRYGLVDDSITYTANVTISSPNVTEGGLKVQILAANSVVDKTILLTKDNPSYTYTTSSFTPTVTRDSKGKITGGKAFQVKIFSVGLYHVNISFNKPIVPGLTEAYFDSNYTGLCEGTIDRPFNNIDILKSLDLKACKKIYLKCNSIFPAPLDFNELIGTSDDPYLLTSYGTGNKPIIKGNNITNDALLDITNCSYFTVDGLEFMDTAIAEGDRRAIRLISNGDNESSTIYDYSYNKITNCYIHDIKGILDAENAGMSYKSKSTGGIHVLSTDGKGRFKNLDISYNKIENVDNCGIASWPNVTINDKSSSTYVEGSTPTPYDDVFDDIAHLDMHIHHNDISNIGKNAIFNRHTVDCLIEYNVIHDTAYRCYSGNQIVTAFTKRTVVQHNEGYNNKAHLRGTTLQDGAFLDPDVYSSESVWQYNYSHDNTFGLFINCTKNEEERKDSAIVRYNVSINDLGDYAGTKDRGIFTFNYDIGSLEVYNNTVITGPNTKSIIGASSNATTYHFYNNLIYNRSENAEFRIKTGCNNVSYNNNLIFNSAQSAIKKIADINTYDNNYLTVDPTFIGSLLDEAPFGIDSVGFLKLDNSSPCKNAGATIPSSCIFDYFGLKANNTIGFSSNI